MVQPNERSIYPNVIFGYGIDKLDRYIEFSTWLRKKGEDGQYYLIPFYKKTYGSDQLGAYKVFVQEIYNHLILAEPTLEIISPLTGESIQKLDDNQEEEEQRLSKLLHGYNEWVQAKDKQ